MRTIRLRDGRTMRVPGLFVPGVGRIMRWRHLLGLVSLSNELGISLTDYSVRSFFGWVLVYRRDITEEFKVVG